MLIILKQIFQNMQYIRFAEPEPSSDKSMQFLPTPDIYSMDKLRSSILFYELYFYKFLVNFCIMPYHIVNNLLSNPTVMGKSQNT